MLREIISRCKTIKYCADNFTQDFGLDYFLYYFYFFLLFILFLHSILSFEILYLYLHKKEKPPFFYGGSVIYTYYIDNKSKVFILLLLLSIYVFKYLKRLANHLNYT